jgi:hypothetical protein
MRSGDRENDPAVQAATAGRILWHRLGRADQHAAGDGGGLRTVAELDTKDNFRILRIVPVQYNRIHGLDWDRAL